MNLTNKFRMLRKQEGFTLVELIVVIAIVAIFAGVAVPAYSGYITKANITADKQLVNEVNKAFVSACMMAGESNINHPEAKDQTIDKNGILTYEGANAEYFKSFFEGGEFKVATKLEYDEVNGVFTAPELEDGGSGNGGAFSNLLSTIKDKYAQAIEATKNTSLGKIGTDVLFDQMNSAMNMAGELDLVGLTGVPFNNAFCSYLGIDPKDYDDPEKLEEDIAAALGGLGIDDGKTAMTHAIALYAAQNSTNLATKNLSRWLGGNTTMEDLQKEPNANTLAEAAAIYSMYLSYSKEKTGSVPEGTTLDVMGDALTDSDFATWVNSSDSNAQKELDAYKTYMGFINEAAQDEDAKNAILANGFNNPEMEDLVKDLMGN